MCMRTSQMKYTFQGCAFDCACTLAYTGLKGLVHPKMKILSFITLMSFHTRKTFVHLQKTYKDIFDKIRWLSEACIASKTINTFNVQKATKDVFKTVHVTTVVQH